MRCVTKQRPGALMGDRGGGDAGGWPPPQLLGVRCGFSFFCCGGRSRRCRKLSPPARGAAWARDATPAIACPAPCDRMSGILRPHRDRYDALLLRPPVRAAKRIMCSNKHVARPCREMSPDSRIHCPVAAAAIAAAATPRSCDCRRRLPTVRVLRLVRRPRRRLVARSARRVAGTAMACRYVCMFSVCNGAEWRVFYSVHIAHRAFDTHGITNNPTQECVEQARQMRDRSNKRL